jgi:hypothetical protein
VIVGCLIYNYIYILAVEFFDSTCSGLVDKHLNLINPLSDYPFYVLVETSGSHEDHDQQVDQNIINHLILYLEIEYISRRAIVT